MPAIVYNGNVYGNSINTIVQSKRGTITADSSVTSQQWWMTDVTFENMDVVDGAVVCSLSTRTRPNSFSVISITGNVVKIGWYGQASSFPIIDFIVLAVQENGNEPSDEKPYAVPVLFKSHGSSAVAFAHIPQNKTNVKITQCVNYGVADYVNNCTISYNAPSGLVAVTCTNTAIIDKLSYAQFTWD